MVNSMPTKTDVLLIFIGILITVMIYIPNQITSWLFD
ncbi:MAG: hypothetical protein FD160_976 [Caulobacteraceae bacterium]|nr:MAG: hypothetical protein FD160_976 [Caulobacteraceae bacterium]